MILRRADRKDLHSIYGLIRLLGDSPPRVELECALGDILQDPRRELVLIADEQDEPVGIMCLHQGLGQGTDTSRVTVHELLIHPGYRGLGLEQRLLGFAEQYSHSARACLHVEPRRGIGTGLLRRRLGRGDMACGGGDP